jgi:LysR family transcriptional regulator, glycine cleavage system transcriptional activator
MSRRRLPPLNSLRAFEAAARHQSIVAAASELSVTHGAVSKQIQILEKDLGASLFDRRNRGIHLTRSGEWLAIRLGSVFGDLGRIMGEFRHVGVEPLPLTISCEPTLCLRMLIPALSELKRETRLDARVLAAGGYIDLDHSHVDIAIRRSDTVIPKATNNSMLAPELMGPVMLPALADTSPELVPCLHSDTRPNAWKDWGHHPNMPKTETRQNIHFEHFYLAIQAAEAGQGMAMASLHMVADALAAGRLCAPYGFKPDGTHYVAIRPSGTVDDRSAVFIGWLKQRMVSREYVASSAGEKNGS